jgi:hypothetical protein
MLTQRFKDCSMARANVLALKAALKPRRAVLHAEQHPTDIANRVELRKCRLEMDETAAGGLQALLQLCATYGLFPEGP